MRQEGEGKSKTAKYEPIKVNAVDGMLARNKKEKVRGSCGCWNNLSVGGRQEMRAKFPAQGSDCKKIDSNEGVCGPDANLKTPDERYESPKTHKCNVLSSGKTPMATETDSRRRAASLEEGCSRAP